MFIFPFFCIKIIYTVQFSKLDLLFLNPKLDVRISLKTFLLYAAKNNVKSGQEYVKSGHLLFCYKLGLLFEPKTDQCTNNRKQRRIRHMNFLTIIIFNNYFFSKSKKLKS